ncbi:hypothetical protein LX32DRAFT_637560 [Colletotrichum zoysiae]|uniref:Uncharacterized protein n=1 Tax=Colletotrichum zoysiae TaxID=1216348 RepID=A0AAD9M742_9PEZI|nr:hypothetical protein LX32DRAFT_637560 [Colletotrichum zoysiae]
MFATLDWDLDLLIGHVQTKCEFTKTFIKHMGGPLPLSNLPGATCLVTIFSLVLCMPHMNDPGRLSCPTLLLSNVAATSM